MDYLADLSRHSVEERNSCQLNSLPGFWEVLGLAVPCGVAKVLISNSTELHRDAPLKEYITWANLHEPIILEHPALTMWSENCAGSIQGQRRHHAVRKVAIPSKSSGQALQTRTTKQRAGHPFAIGDFQRLSGD